MVWTIVIITFSLLQPPPFPFTSIHPPTSSRPGPQTHNSDLGSHANPRARVLESIKAGKRLPEARFSNLKVAMKGQRSVYGAFSKSQYEDPAVLRAVSGL